MADIPPEGFATQDRAGPAQSKAGKVKLDTSNSGLKLGARKGGLPLSFKFDN